MTLSSTGWPRRAVAYLKKTPLLIGLLAVLFVGSLLVFAGVVHEVLGENEQGFDTRVFSFFRQHLVGPSLTPFMKVMTFFGSAPWQFIVYPLLIILYGLRKKKRTALDILLIAV